MRPGNPGALAKKPARCLELVIEVFILVSLILGLGGFCREQKPSDSPDEQIESGHSE